MPPQKIFTCRFNKIFWQQKQNVDEVKKSSIFITNVHVEARSPEISENQRSTAPKSTPKLEYFMQYLKLQFPLAFAFWHVHSRF